MDDYISREAALKVCDDSKIIGIPQWNSGIEHAEERIRKIPASDVRPVKRGSWIEDGYYNEPCVCSECGEPCKDTLMGKPRWNFCPICGSMNGRAE